MGRLEIENRLCITQRILSVQISNAGELVLETTQLGIFNVAPSSEVFRQQEKDAYIKETAECEVE